MSMCVCVYARTRVCVCVCRCSSKLLKMVHLPNRDKTPSRYIVFVIQENSSDVAGYVVS